MMMMMMMMIDKCWRWMILVSVWSYGCILLETGHGINHLDRPSHMGEMMFTLGNGMPRRWNIWGTYGIDKLWQLMGAWVGWLRHKSIACFEDGTFIWRRAKPKTSCKHALVLSLDVALPNHRCYEESSLSLGSSPSPLVGEVFEQRKISALSSPFQQIPKLKKTTIWLVVSTLWKICKSVGMIIPNIWKNKTCSKPPTRNYLYEYMTKIQSQLRRVVQVP